MHEDVAVSTGPMRVGLLNAVIQGGHIRIVADKGTISPGSCVAYGIMVRKDLFEKGIVRMYLILKGGRRIYAGFRLQSLQCFGPG